MLDNTSNSGGPTCAHKARNKASQRGMPLTNMKKIIFCDQYGQLGGGQQILLELVRAALADHFVVDVLLPEGPCAKQLTAMGATVVPVPLCPMTQGKKSIGDMLRFASYGIAIFWHNLARLRSADLIYVNGNRLLPVALLAQLFLRKNVACHIHLNHGRLEQKLFRFFLDRPHTKGIVAPSAFIQRELVRSDAAFDSPKVQVVENGLDARFSAIPFEDRFSGRPLRHVGIVGRVSPEKGQDVLPDLARRFPDMEFHVLGDAAFSSTNFYQSLQQDSPANLHFHGWIEDLPTFTRQLGLQVCLVPSRCPANSPDRSFEAAPLVPLQMAALSCIVMVRNLGTLADVATSLGLRSFETDIEIAQRLETLRNMDSAALAQEARTGYTIIMRSYNNDAFQQKLRGLFASLCG